MTVVIAQRESVFRLFWRYTFPSVLAMLVSGIYVIIDGIFIGQFVGEQGLAAIGVAYPLMTFFTGVGLMIGIGGGAIISYKRGTGDPQGAVRALSTSLLLLLLAALVTVFYMEFASVFLTLQGASGTLLQMSLDYISVFQYTALSAIASAALPLLIRNDDSPNFATVIMIAGALLNVVLNYCLLVLLDMGITGAAWATVLSMTAVCLVALKYFYSARATIALNRTALVFDRDDGAKIIAIGSSVLVMHLYAGFVIAIHNALFVQYGNNISLSAYAIVGYLMSLYYMLAEGIGGGIQPLLSYFQGRAQMHKIRQLVKLAVYITIGLGIGFYLLLNAWPTLYIQWFNSEIEVVEKSINGLRYHLIGMFIDGFIALASVYFMAFQNAKIALFISLANIVIQLPFLYILPQYWGEFGIWIALPLSNIVMLVLVAPLLWRDLKRGERSVLSASGAV